MTTITRRLRSAAIAAALVAPLAALVPAAHADAPLGAVTLSPGTGMASEGSTIIETHGACPAGTQAVKARLTGPGILDNTKNNLVGNTQVGIVAPNVFGGYDLNLANTISSVLLNNGVVAPNGDYNIEVVCQDTPGVTIYGLYSGTIHVVHGASDDAGDGTYTTVVGGSAVTTSTTLDAGPTQPVVAGTASTLTANVTPTTAAGTVQFKRGGVNVGSPAAVSSGVATYNGALSAGSGSLTAVFVPADANAYKTSTSASVSYVVAGKPAVSGTVAVGRAVTCAAVAGGTQTFAWLVNGAVQSGYTSASATVPAGWAGRSLTCSDTVTVATTSVVQASAGRTVALGAALRATAKPTVTGVFKKGKKLTAHHGTWTPAAAAYTYQWMRNGKPIAGATKATYKLAKADKGKKISLKVVAKKTGYTSGTSTSAAKKVA